MRLIAAPDSNPKSNLADVEKAGAVSSVRDDHLHFSVGIVDLACIDTQWEVLGVELQIVCPSSFGVCVERMRQEVTGDSKERARVNATIRRHQ